MGAGTWCIVIVVQRGRRFARTLGPSVGAMSAIAATALLFGASIGEAGASPNRTSPGVAKVARAITGIERTQRYREADWGYTVLNQSSGKVLLSQNQSKMFDPGSTMKVYSVSSALRVLGPSYKFRTPVYRQGPVTGGTLNGNLVLVASGDLTFGLRRQPNGTLYYENLPKVDQSYADQLPGAVEPPGNPMSALNQLAARVRASGITHVNGNVVIDDRLFEPYVFPDGLTSPMWVNENLVDLLLKPTSVGAHATLSRRPITASYTVTNRVITVGASKPTSINVTEPTPGKLLVTGQIAAHSAPTLRIWEVDHPSAFARTAFIEALQRAGVSVTAPATGANPTALLPRKGSYKRSDLLGEHVSVPLAQYAKLILKVSYNRGADLMVCLAAAKVGSTNCLRGLGVEVKTATDLGVARNSFFPEDGAGSDDQGRTTPLALATFLRNVVKTSYGKYLVQSLPILGRDGTLANVLNKSPAAGHAQVKTGNRVITTPAGQSLVLGNSLAGYAQTKHHRGVVFMIAVGNVPIKTGEAFLKVVNDQARMVLAIQQDL